MAIPGLTGNIPSTVSFGNPAANPIANPVTTVQPGNASTPDYSVVNGGGYTVGGTSYDQFGDPVKAPAAASASVSDPYLEAIKAATAAANAARAANIPVTPPPIDTAAINAQARTAAENNVNPYYTKAINEFVANQAAQKSQQEQSTQQQIQDFNDTLTNTTNANAVTGARTAEDTATKEADVNQTADWRQTDQGGQYDMDRVAQAVAAAKAGGTGSGLSAKAALNTQKSFNTTESRQATADQETKDAAELSKARTFEDLATSNTLAKQSTDKGVAKANFDLSSFLTNQAYTETQGVDALQQSKNEALVAEIQRQSKDQVASFINSIANPDQKVAAYKAYGSLY